MMTDHPPGARRPVITVRHLCAVAAEMGLNTDDVLAGTSISVSDLEDADAEVCGEDECIMVRNLFRLAPDPSGLGVVVGSRINLTNLGMFGFAAMACGSLRELISIGLRFFSLTTLHTSITLVDNPVRCEVILGADHLPEDVRRFFVERDIAGIVATVPAFVHPVLARYADEVRVEVAADEEYLHPLFVAAGIRNVSYGCERTVTSIPRQLLDEPLPQADEHTLAVCIAQCEQILARRNDRQGYSALVRSQLLSSPGDMPGLDEVATSLHLHSRTLRRRLTEEGTSFRALTNEVRAALATELLGQVGLSVEEVAHRLGYAETAAFNHAFTRWFGLAPTDYRRGRSR